ncbi:unnamed protein product [Rotaria socialis]
MERYITVKEESIIGSEMDLPLDDEFSISIDLLNSYFPNVSGLKFKNDLSGRWQGHSSLPVRYIRSSRVGTSEEISKWSDLVGLKIFSGDKIDATGQILFQIHTEPNSNTTGAATSTATRTSDSPPITTRRTGRQYIKCLLSGWFPKSDGWHKKLQ